MCSSGPSGGRINHASENPRRQTRASAMRSCSVHPDSTCLVVGMREAAILAQNVYSDVKHFRERKYADQPRFFSPRQPLDVRAGAPASTSASSGRDGRRVLSASRLERQYSQLNHSRCASGVASGVKWRQFAAKSRSLTLEMVWSIRRSEVRALIGSDSKKRCSQEKKGRSPGPFLRSPRC